MRKPTLILLAILLLGLTQDVHAKQWTLKECIAYAIQNNITLKKSLLQKMSAQEDIAMSQAALLPSLSASSSQNVTYRPWPNSSQASVQNGYVQSSVDKTYYNGSYGISANWTVWNGGRNTNAVKMNKIAAEQAELDSATTANQLIEQIAQLFVQILYIDEAIKVNKASLETSIANEESGARPTWHNSLPNVPRMSTMSLKQRVTPGTIGGNSSNSCSWSMKRSLKSSLRRPPTRWHLKLFPSCTTCMKVR